MVRRSTRLALLSAALLAAAASGAATVSTTPLSLLAASSVSVTPDPAQQLTAMARAFRNNDLGGLLRTVLPEGRYEQLRAEYEIHRNKNIEEDDRAEFAREWGKLTAPNAVDALMAEIEPKLNEARPKAAGALLMAAGALQMAASGGAGELTASQQQSLQAVLPGLQAWLSGTDFLSTETMREALGHLTEAARGTGIRSIDDFRSMSFDQMLSRAGTMVGAGKRALALYGLDVNAIIDSLRIEVLEVSGDRAKVRTTVTLFDAPVSTEHELRLVEGRWGGPQGFVGWKHRHDHNDDDTHDAVKVEIEADA